MAKFEKGQSGNPGGRPKEDQRLKELARAKTVQAVATLAKIMVSSKSPAAARVAAAIALLDRGYGKPKQQTEISGPDGSAVPHSVTVEFVGATQPASK